VHIREKATPRNESLVAAAERIMRKTSKQENWPHEPVNSVGSNPTVNPPRPREVQIGNMLRVTNEGGDFQMDVTSFLTGNQICREADRATLLTDRTRIRQTAENGETREVREPPHMTLRLLSTTINAFFVVLFLLSGQVHAASPSNPHFKAVAFDYFVILDPDSVVPEVEKAFPSKGVEFTRDLAQ
jgi:hypothetical protein